ncbi:MAG: DUF362 domain-containing protein [bacterium]
MFYSEQIGDVTLAKVKDSKDLRRLIKPYVEGSETVIIKPNFVEKAIGTYTSPESLRTILEAIDQKIIVTEGHQLVRCLNDDEKNPEFTADGETRDLLWLKKNGWGWMIRNPNWNWFRDGPYWDFLKKIDQRYLYEMGFTDLFNEFDLEWINVTDEIWSGETIEPDLVKETVESKYPPVQHERLYGYLPKKLYKYRGTPFISYSKLKHYATFSMKNMFGMIPDPIRAWWHGKNGEYHQCSILDINKIYSAFFNMVGICEAIDNTPIWDENGVYGGPDFKYNVVENLGFAGVSGDLVQLDSVMNGLGRNKPQDTEHIALAGGILGKYDESLVEQGKKISDKWMRK